MPFTIKQCFKFQELFVTSLMPFYIADESSRLYLWRDGRMHETAANGDAIDFSLTPPINWSIAFTSINSGWFETEEEAKAFLASHLSKQQASAAPIVDQ